MQASPSGTIGTQAFHAIDYDPVNNVFVFITEARRTWAYRYAGSASRVENKAQPLPSMNRLYASPNPFGSAVTLSVQGSAPDMTLKVYDLGGGLVADLTQGMIKGDVTWRPACRPGVYAARLVSGGTSASQKLVLLR